MPFLSGRFGQLSNVVDVYRVIVYVMSIMVHTPCPFKERR